MDTRRIPLDPTSRRMTRLAFVFGLLLATAGCQSTDINENRSAGPLVASHEHVLGEGGYRRTEKTLGDRTPELLLLATFSGGGKRSSAFSYGVLRGLRDTALQTKAGQRRLLDEVSGIASVSGGTFTSAYYGLYRDRIFTAYESDFLKRDIEAYIWGIYFMPWRWGWMIDPRFGTSDAMSQVYDDLIFHGATYADLEKLGLPILWIGATDISYGRVFTFNQDTFDLLCSDLRSLPLAQAVAASNGLPILFSPITLENHAGDCNGWRPRWMHATVQADEDTQTRRRILAQAAESYLDSKRTPYIHLSDGGIVDNLALRGLLNQILLFESDAEFQRAQNFAAMRRLVVIVADGEAAQNTAMAREQVVTGLGQIINSVSGSQIDNYNFETLSLTRKKIADTVEQIKAIRCRIAPVIEGHPCGDVEGYLLHFALSQIKDEATKARLEEIPTGLTLSNEDVDALVAAGEEQVKTSPVIAQIVRDLSVSPAAPAPAASLRQ